MKNELILYSYFRSSTSYRVRIALELKKVNYQYAPVHLVNDGGQQYQEAYKKINPLSEVPSLVHNGQIIAQSMAILEYLEEVYPSPHLLPKNPLQRAHIRQFCENINSFIHPLCNLKVLAYLETKHQYSSNDKQEWIQTWAHKGLQSLEVLLQRSAGLFCFGDEISFADIFLIPQVFSALRFNVDLKKYPLIEKINNQCLQLTEFQKAHPYRQPDTPQEFLIS